MTKTVNMRVVVKGSKLSKSQKHLNLQIGQNESNQVKLPKGSNPPKVQDRQSDQ